MKALKFTILTTVALICGSTSLAGAQIVTEGEAWTVAENYLNLIVNRKGDWGGALDARIAERQELTRGDRVLGYFFRVEPKGFLVTSRHKEISPVKAYSATSDLDPKSDIGLADLIKGRLEHTIKGVELRIGKSVDEASPDDWDLVIETDYRPAWAELADKDFDPTLYQSERSSRSVGMNYQEGEVLVTTHWHQHPPYNDQCPIPIIQILEPPYWMYVPCDNTSNGRKLVGCVATAGVQVLRYWNWPPCNAAGEYVDTYNWTNMPDDVYTNSPQDQIDCVAAASHAVAVAVDMDFGCERSSAYTYDMEQVYENRRYHNNLNRKDRNDYTASAWYDLLVGQFNINRPVHYRVEGHSIVGDGWQIIDIGGVPTKQYHMNYGWGGTGEDSWYDLDDLHLGGYDEEYVLRTIYPEIALGENLYGHHPTVWESINHFDKPTRYFDQDASAIYAEFDAGQAFQYLRPGLHIQHLGPYSDTAFIKFNGAPGAVTEFYHGAPLGDTKIRIADGAIKFQNGGEMCVQ